MNAKTSHYVHFLTCFIALALLGVPTPVSAVTLDFDTLITDFGPTGYGPSYSEDGFTLTQDAGEPFPLSYFGPSNFEYTGSPTLFNNTQQGVTTLTQDNGDPFTVLSIDLAELNPPTFGTDPTDVIFTGYLSVGGTVLQTFTTDGIPGAETFLFNPGFTGLLALSWVQDLPGHQFDNIVLIGTVEAVPLPAGLPLLAGGLGLMGWLARRRRTQAAHA